MLHKEGYRNFKLYCTVHIDFCRTVHKTARLQSSVTVHTTKLQVYRVQWQSTLPNCTSTEFSDSPHYQTAGLQSSVTVHTTKLQVYRVQWQSTLPNCTSTEFSDKLHVYNDNKLHVCANYNNVSFRSYKHNEREREREREREWATAITHVEPVQVFSLNYTYLRNGATTKGRKRKWQREVKNL